jgi:hypothetical protein
MYNTVPENYNLNYKLIHSEQINLSMLITLALLTFGILSCGTENNSSQIEVPSQEMSLKVGEEPIAVDSLSASLGTNNIVTIKIYCTSSYPIPDSSLAEKNELMFIKLRTSLSLGKQLMPSSADYETMYMGYELKNGTYNIGSSMSYSKQNIHWIEINSLDKENQLFSFEMHTMEFITTMDVVLGKKAEKTVVFKGSNIKYVNLY